MLCIVVFQQGISLEKTATSPLKRKNIDETLINQICFNPRLAFKFHSRLIAILFCAFIAIWTTVMFFVAVLGPGIDYIAQVAVYYWQVYAPAIAVFDLIISNSNTTINNFDAERIKGIVQVFQERGSFLNSLMPSDGEIFRA